jgi:hypothetical protein
MNRHHTSRTTVKHLNRRFNSRCGSYSWICRFERSYVPVTKLSTVPAESHGLISASDPSHVPQNEQLESTANSAGKMLGTTTSPWSSGAPASARRG